MCHVLKEINHSQRVFRQRKPNYNFAPVKCLKYSKSLFGSKASSRRATTPQFTYNSSYLQGVAHCVRQQKGVGAMSAAGGCFLNSETAPWGPLRATSLGRPLHMLLRAAKRELNREFTHPRHALSLSPSVFCVCAPRVWVSKTPATINSQSVSPFKDEQSASSLAGSPCYARPWHLNLITCPIQQHGLRATFFNISFRIKRIMRSAI